MITLKERIDADIKIAMLAKNPVAVAILRFIKGEIQRKEAGLQILSDADIEKLMRSQIESLKITNSATSEEEIAVLENYLPKLMDKKQIKAIVVKYCDDHVASGGQMSDINVGTIMKYWNSNFKGQADNKLVSEAANEILK